MRSWSADGEERELPVCPLGVEAPSYVQCSLAPEIRRRFEEHLRGCPHCREDVREAREVLGAMRASPEPVRQVDLLPGILARLPAEEPPRRPDLQRPRLSRRKLLPWLAAAAGLILAALGVEALRSERQEAGPRADAVDLAFEWLLNAQEPDGGFRAARWSGHSTYDVGLTALASLAFLNRNADEGSRISRALDSSLAYLEAAQSPEGRFGPEVPAALFNHGIATVALLEAFGGGQDARQGQRLRVTIDRALRYIASAQTPEGGWGYLGVEQRSANTPATCWPLQALLLGRALGFTGLDPSIEGGLRHLARVSDASGRIGYSRAGEFLYGAEGPTSMGAFCFLLTRGGGELPTAARARVLDGLARARMGRRAESDLYRDFFMSAALDALPAERGGRWPDEARRALAETQVQAGPLRGSWEPRDAWSAAGGRVYSTALSALILESDRRARRLGKWLGA